ncbi:MAG: hypothetical protein HW414_1278 [Dehalococcoidia bacterium]|nr:hypothetical protein [Dehalococcoidia bacterium]
MGQMEQIAEAAAKRELVVFAGAGVSCDAGLPNWLGLAQRLLDKLKEEGKVPSEYVPLIESLSRNQKNRAKPSTLSSMLHLIEETLLKH